MAEFNTTPRQNNLDQNVKAKALARAYAFLLALPDTHVKNKHEPAGDLGGKAAGSEDEASNKDADAVY